MENEKNKEKVKMPEIIFILIFYAVKIITKLLFIYFFIIVVCLTPVNFGLEYKAS